MCDLCDGTTFCQLNVCSDCKSNIDNMEQIFNSLQQLKAEIAAWVKRWDSASKDPCGLREFPTIDELRQLSAI